MSPGAPSPEFLRLVPRDFARAHLVLSEGPDDAGRERLLAGPAATPAALHNVGVRLGRPVTVRAGDAEAIARAIDEAYAAARSAGEERGEPAGSHAGPDQGAASIERLLAEADSDLLSTQGKGPIVKLVDAILFEALAKGASDVHVQPLLGPPRLLVRYRVDGVLRTVRELPAPLAGPVVSRIKVMGRMDIAERRVPQDGRAAVSIGRVNGAASVTPLEPGPAAPASEPGAEDHPASAPERGAGRSVDLRISTLPTSHGERAVIRLLESGRGAHLKDFGSLGMPADTETRYLRRAARPNGIVLVTGPTGSGKTTTLYATLRRVAQEACGPGGAGTSLNIMTIEDPIEYELSGTGLAVSQSQVNSKKGVSFATGLRHILRQDPDVIMVGEIRDAETARIAIQSSLTGHLVLSTLHTNDAPSAVTRLVDLGIEPYLVASSLEAVLAQRLVRRSHAPCAGAGCEGCLQSGFRGRTGLYELLPVDEPIRELIGRGASVAQLREAAVRAGMRTLAEEGRRLVRAGLTTPAEVARVVQAGDEEAVPLEAERLAEAIK